MAEVNARDQEKAQFAFSIYDFDGNDTIDAVDLGLVLRALNFTPSLKSIEKLGGTKKKGEKKLKFADFLSIYAQCKKDKEGGVFSDYMECLKLYDKSNSGKMIRAELLHILQAMGETLTKEEAERILQDCCEEEDEDGFVPYKTFLLKLLDGPFPEKE